jgi:hypothetical protein
MVIKFREEELEMRGKRKALILKYDILPILVLSLCSLLTAADTAGKQASDDGFASLIFS